MAMVAAGIANDGVVMNPRVVDRILEPDGSILTQTPSEELSEAVSRETAAELTAMMELAVQSGTGTAAQIPGVRVAGKTGTAETGDPDRNNAWFIGFAPADAPQVAVAVVLSDQAGTGGQLAAPIAGTLMDALLGGVA
jgi:peptidoglycan glycosyltransferase